MTRRTPAQYDWSRLRFDETILPSSWGARSSKRRLGKPRYVVAHHMTIVGNGDGSANDKCYNTWKNREASAHYGVDGQHVRQFIWDNLAAWATGSTIGNHLGYSIEHANLTRQPNWKVADTTWRTGARLAAQLHVVKGLGRPVSNYAGSTGTLRQHDTFKATACPGPHLGGPLWPEYLKEAQRWYDAIIAGGDIPDPWDADVKADASVWVITKTTLTGRSTPEYKVGNVRATRVKGTRLTFTKTVHHNDRWWHYNPADKLWYQQRSKDGKTLFMGRTTTNLDERAFLSKIDGLILREQPYPGQPTGDVLDAGDPFNAVGYEDHGTTRWWVDGQHRWASEKYLTETAGGQPAPDDTLRFALANVYGGYDADDKNWSERRDKVAERLDSIDADVLACLELHENAEADLEGFRLALGSPGEYDMHLGGDSTAATHDGNVLFTRSTRVQVEASGGLWTYGKRHQDAYVIRNTDDGRRYVAVVLHLIAGKPHTRAVQMAQTIAWLPTFQAANNAVGLPVVWIGDLNNQSFYEGSPLEQLASFGVQTLAQRLGKDYENGDRPSHHGGSGEADIDHIGTIPNELEVVAGGQVITDDLGGDHDFLWMDARPA